MRIQQAHRGLLSYKSLPRIHQRHIFPNDIFTITSTRLSRTIITSPNTLDRITTTNNKYAYRNMDNTITNHKVSSLLSSAVTTSLSEANAKKCNVFIRDPVAVAKKLDKIVKDGIESLHMISDFDMTLTKYHNTEGKRSVSTHGILARTNKATPEIKAAKEAIFQKYYPIEISTTMTEAEKTPSMIEWWEQAHDLIIQMNISRKDLTAMVMETPVTWRDGANAVTKWCEKKNVPLLVFSAGLADIIEEILRQSSMLGKNVHVISNRMVFTPPKNVNGPVDDKDYVCTAFSEPLIHVFNKNESAINPNNTEYFNQVAHRRNVMLMGDSLGDLKMAHGIKHDVCLTIGFCNHDVENLFEDYQKKFDIVILNDASFEWVNGLLSAME